MRLHNPAGLVAPAIGTARNHATNLPDEAVAIGSMVRDDVDLATELDGEEFAMMPFSFIGKLGCTQAAETRHRAGERTALDQDR